jgi:hypothetical protein
MSRFLLFCAFLTACADDAPTETDSPGTTPTASHSGTAGTTCAEADCADTQYCSSTAPATTGGELGNASCHDLPGGCSDDATCACLLSIDVCVSCTDDAESGLPWCID